MYRVHCIRRADKENAASFMLRSLLLWTKMMSFSRERGGKCGRLSKVGDVVGVLWGIQDVRNHEETGITRS